MARGESLPPSWSLGRWGQWASTPPDSLDRKCMGTWVPRGKQGWRGTDARPAKPLEGGRCPNHVHPARFGGHQLGHRGVYLRGRAGCLQGTGNVGEPSGFLYGGSMCKLICHPQKLPGAPLWASRRGRGPPASLPASWTSQMLVCADSFADRAFLPLAFVQSVNTPWEFSGGPAEPGQEGQQGFPAG